MNKFKVITVLDYESGKVTQYNVNNWKIDLENIYVFLHANEHNLAKCYWLGHEDATIYIK